MATTLGPEASRLVQATLSSGAYQSVDELVVAGIEALRVQQAEFDPGELQMLISAGEESIDRAGTVPADQVSEQLKQISDARRERG